MPDTAAQHTHLVRPDHWTDDEWRDYLRALAGLLAAAFQVEINRKGTTP